MADMRRDDEQARRLSFFVPSGFLLMKQAEIDRIHNESEALRIERDAARAEAERLAAFADGETDKLRDALRELDEAGEALRRIAYGDFGHAAAFYVRGVLDKTGDGR